MQGTDTTNLQATRVDSVILAGGGSKGLTTELDDKALIEVAGKPMVSHSIEALRACPSVERVVVVTGGLPVGKWSDGADAVIEADGSIVHKVLRAIQHLGRERPLLVTSSDIPLVGREAIEDLLERCREKEADFYYPIISRADAERAFPGAKRTYARVREGTFTGGNMALIDPAVVERNIELCERLYALRKSPVKLLWVLGPIFVVKFFLRLLDIAQLEARVSELIGGRATAVMTPYASIGFDVDKDSDLEAVSRAFGETFGGPMGQTGKAPG